MPVGVQQQTRKMLVSVILIGFSSCSSIHEKLGETLEVSLKLYLISSSSWEGLVGVM